MSKILVLAEKPSVGRDIARVLNCTKTINGALEGKKYIVTWAFGHLVTLCDPEDYDKQYQKWDINDLPIIPKKMKLAVIKNTSKQFNIIKKLLNREDVKKIIIATDAGREGELVARWIIDKTQTKKPMQRLWISSVTDKAIKNGFNNLKDAHLYDSLYQSGYSRSIADWLVGINATRALTCKYNAQLACGRVQTPTLAIINMREEEIKNFVPKKYFGLKIVSQNDIEWSWYKNNGQAYLFDESKIDYLIPKINNQSLKITEINKSIKKNYAPQLYDLTELQRDANQLYGFSAKETLSIMQSLYEYHKVLTYPRTDSRYLSDDIIPTIYERLEASKGGDFDHLINKILSQPIKKHSHFVNNSKVTDHHAIIPTEQPAMIGAFNDREYKIYTLVLKRFLAVLLPPYIYEQTNIKATINNETFITKGKIIKQLGWKKISNQEDENQFLPQFTVNQKISIDQVIKTNNTTTAPDHFNEATLLSAMENPTKYINSSKQEIKKTLKDTGGLGTVATRGDIIEKLFNNFLIEKHGNDIMITAKGKQLLQLVPKDLKEPELTAKWELELQKIAENKQNPNTFINHIKTYTNNLIKQINASEFKYKHDNLTSKKCPKCNNLMLEVNGKKGKLLICSNPNCKHRQTISIITNARCPNCHKKLELVGTKDKQLFVCKNCNYRQSLKAFKKEKKNKLQSANKNDVKKYLRQQQNHQTDIEDSPFAALLKMKIK